MAVMGMTRHRRLVAAGALAALLLLFPSAGAATAFGLSSSVGASTIIPVTLAAAGGNGCNGSCTVVLNAVSTSATVGTVNILPNPTQARQVLKVVHGIQPWSVQVHAASATLATGDSVVLSLAGSTTASLIVTPTSVPGTSSAVTLAGGSGASDLALSARGTCAGVCVLNLEVRLVSGTAAYTYGVTLTVT